MSRYRRTKAFWHKMKFKYKFTVTNENKLEDVVDVRLSKLDGLFIVFTVLLTIFVIVGSVMSYTPLRNILPGYMNSEIRAQVVSNALRVDSFRRVIEMQNLYIVNIQDIFRGTINVDTVHSIDSLIAIREDSLKGRTRREEEFLRKYEEVEKYNLTSVASQVEAMGINFSCPVRGMIFEHFNADIKHYGVDIAPNPNESILATLEGMVILSTYTAQSGYILSIQHNQGFVSVYKHCGPLLKQEGDKVKAGEAIALVSSNHGKPAEDSYLYFELWYKGKAMNPENYIVF
ncbi:Murein hydrolase activator NlpD [termite gut metagenome]|uniref:Murein hydrolase activator NlpD n=1 Tax=termite gut metagenome TaxID=433724 RepID=A0A5J4QLM1_9ZZZZ